MLGETLDFAVDVSGIGFPLQSGNFATTGFPVRNDPGLCGMEIHAQALHLFGVQPFARSNAQVLTLGY